MKKRLLLIALVLILTTGTVMQTEMHAEAAATTVAGVSLAKAVLVLLAIAGVSITAGSGFAFDKYSDENVTAFTTWLRNNDPDFFTAFMVAATEIMSGRTAVQFTYNFFAKLKQKSAEFFGTDVERDIFVGESTFNIHDLAIFMNNHNYSFKTGFGTFPFWSEQPVRVIPFVMEYDGGVALMCLPIRSDLDTAISYGQNLGMIYWQNIDYSSYFTLNGHSVRFARYTMFQSANFATYTDKTKTFGSLYSATTYYVNTYYSGGFDIAGVDLYMRPLPTVGGVAATSTESMVVSPGQTIAEDDEQNIVIDGPITLNLANVNIDDWLKSLSDELISYADAMAQVNLAAVNTQTQTLEEIQTIAEALNPAAAGTGSITGNYTVALSDLFPFCIPFDLYNIISCFKADPVAPSAEITIPVGYDGTEFTWETYTVSLSDFDPVAAVVRVLEYIAFVIGLMLVTRKLIEG